MVDNRQAKMYSEVYEVLEVLGKGYKNQIPKQLLTFIKNKRIKNYNLKYDKNIPLYEQKLEKNSVAFICMLHYNYWCKSEKEKQQIQKILIYNQNKKIAKYDRYKEKFNKRKEESNESRELIPVRTGIIQRIVRYLKALFK